MIQIISKKRKEALNVSRLDKTQALHTPLKHWKFVQFNANA